jgi:geranylgeranyl diphosphate synthase, type II
MTVSAMPDTPDLKTYLVAKQTSVDAALDTYLPRPDICPPIIHEAMRYSVFAGGKRLRPILILMAAELFHKSVAEVMFAAAAIECLHTYSLIHDDLPALDNDALRRGMPTSHIKFGEDIAILAGDALLTLAFQLMTDPQASQHCAPSAVLRATHELAIAAGTLGMVGGQVMDMQAEQRQISAAELEYIHQHKTAKLLTAAVRIGAILADATPADLYALTVYGEQIGLAFQIVDDILDLEGTTSELGKQAQSDLTNQKATYPMLHGMAASKAHAAHLINAAKISLQNFGSRAQYFSDLADFMITRTH